METKKKSQNQKSLPASLDLVSLSVYIILGVFVLAVIFYVVIGIVTIDSVDKAKASAAEAQNSQESIAAESSAAETSAQTEEPSSEGAEQDTSLSEDLEAIESRNAAIESAAASGAFYGVPADNSEAESVAEANRQAAAAVYIHEIPQATIDTIRSVHDGTLQGFGLGLGEKPVTSTGRPQQMVDVQNTLYDNGVTTARIFSSADTSKTVSLTFQAGYDNGYTAKVLDILKEYGIYATFYISHEFAANNPDLVRRMIDEGHEIGNHSYACPDEGIATYSLEEQMADAMKMQTYMQESFNYNMRKYNFNSGYWTVQSVVLMAQMGYEVCFCSINYDDYDPSKEFVKNDVLQDLTGKAHNGAVYCFHMTNKITVEILPSLIEYLRSQEYSILQLE